MNLNNNYYMLKYVLLKGSNKLCASKSTFEWSEWYDNFEQFYG